MTSISGGAINTSFTYDAKGNMTSGNGVGIAYTSYNKPSSISRGSNTLTFQHDAELNRYLQTGASPSTRCSTALAWCRGAKLLGQPTGIDHFARHLDLITPVAFLPPCIPIRGLILRRRTHLSNVGRQVAERRRSMQGSRDFGRTRGGLKKVA